ncbi:hypothetical protein [Endozoicomonas arenosclerae]|uniref:hypothetical protein n=1 Tax=Endozoicomonas arenosclerae TaxID=1633495 RepID=UPI0007841EF3|nr:hypothetical protein [Endozoicomonas arenosclerae]
MKRSDYPNKSIWAAVSILPSILLSGCASPLESLNCHYQPVRGSLVFTEVDGDLAELIFQPDAEQDLKWFKKYGINPDDLEMSIANKRQSLELDTRYNGIINIRISGSCSPYIVYQGNPVLSH